MSWRLQQLAQFYNNDAIIEQDARLIEFAQQHGVKQLCFSGENDIDYFQQRLPDTGVSRYDDQCQDMLAVFKTSAFFNFEDFLQTISNMATATRPRLLYIAINKYAVQTHRSWTDLSDDYDADLLNLITQTVSGMGYKELSRHYKEDRGQYFNFAHPTTNIYYERDSDRKNTI